MSPAPLHSIISVALVPDDLLLWRKEAIKAKKRVCGDRPYLGIRAMKGWHSVLMDRHDMIFSRPSSTLRKQKGLAMSNRLRRYYHNWMASYHYTMLDSLLPEAEELRKLHSHRMIMHKEKYAQMER